MLSTVRLAPLRLEPEKKKVKDLRLTMDLPVEFIPVMDCDPCVTRKLRILVDTGAEINLIRNGIVGSPYLSAVKRPLRIAAANQATMYGGEYEVHCMIALTGMEVDTGE